MTLLVHTYPGANETMVRHLPYWNFSGMGSRISITTSDRECVVPDGMDEVQIGRNSYMDGPVLPERLMNTIAASIYIHDEWFCCIEYDTLILNPKAFDGIDHIKTDEPTVFCHRTGGQTFDAKVPWFSHNPWIWNKAAARVLVPEMQKIIDENHCAYGRAESSPDVFWAFACERSKVTVIHDYFTMHSRNSFDCEGALQEACDAVAMGVQVLHGCKHPHELEAIQNAMP